MELREKIVREAFAKKGVKPLLSHLRAITLGSDEIDTLALLLKRGCLPLFEYPNAKGDPHSAQGRLDEYVDCDARRNRGRPVYREYARKLESAAPIGWQHAA